jgi:putative nucleotidyltransferase with HDIG domain
VTINETDHFSEDLSRMKESLAAALEQNGSTKSGVSTSLKDVLKHLNSLDDQVQQLVSERNGLRTLAGIGESLTSTLDSNTVLEKMLDSIIQLAQAERCFLMLLDSDGSTHVQIGRNWKQENISEEEKAISTTIVNEVIKNRQPVLTTDAEKDPRFDGTESVVNFKLRSVMCVPLLYQVDLLGVIYADHRLRSEQFSKEKINLLSKFANQAAIALHNVNLYESLQETHHTLQNTHSELEQAYDTTLEGWAKVLELRDPTTEGHTQRVVSLSIQLAKQMGINDQDLINIRRGAVLHDIGKMAIPDDVLCKPGSLTDEEVKIMRMHPMLAVEMLSKIRFLEDALAIPRYHHERWDGKGYPDGLTGEDIPLAARIFAVVDVWDALINERPSREALTEEEAIAHIKNGAGSHFDPDVVQNFLKMVGK